MSKLLEYCKFNKYFSTIKNLEEYLQALIDVYKNEDRLSYEFKKMNLWLIANPNREKKNYKRFINSWLSKQESQMQAQNYIKSLSNVMK